MLLVLLVVITHALQAPALTVTQAVVLLFVPLDWVAMLLVLSILTATKLEAAPFVVQDIV